MGIGGAPRPHGNFVHIPTITRKRQQLKSTSCPNMLMLGRRHVLKLAWLGNNVHQKPTTITFRMKNSPWME
jgi:hypothetical protein